MVFWVKLDKPFIQEKTLRLTLHLFVQFGNAEDDCRIEAVVAVPLFKNWNNLVIFAFRSHQTNEPLKAVLEVRVHSDSFFQPKAGFVVVFERLPPFSNLKTETRKVSCVTEPLKEQYCLFLTHFQSLATLSCCSPCSTHFCFAADFY